MGMLLLPVVLIVEGAIGLAMASAYRPESWTFALLDLCVAVPYCIGLVLVGGTPLRVGSRDASSLRFSGAALTCAGALPIGLLVIHYGWNNGLLPGLSGCIPLIMALGYASFVLIPATLLFHLRGIMKLLGGLWIARVLGVVSIGHLAVSLRLCLRMAQAGSVPLPTSG